MSPTRAFEVTPAAHFRGGRQETSSESGGTHIDFASLVARARGAAGEKILAP